MNWLDRVNLSIIDQSTSLMSMFLFSTLKDPDSEFKTIYDFDKHFSVKDIFEMEKFIERDLAFHKAVIDYTGDNNTKVQYYRMDGAAALTKDAVDQSYRFYVKTTNLDLFNKIKDKFSKLEAYKPSGFVKMLIRNGPGYDLLSIGKVKSKFEPTNYEKDIVESFNHLNYELSVQDPCGRLAILHGEPGTGKSFFIKGLINSNSAPFVFIPSSLIGQLSGPDLAGVLFREMEDHTNMEERKDPLVLIMEDADFVLAKRSQSGNLGQLGELLNFSDGILGDIANIRVIATTNAPLINIDDAFLRSGRLCTQVKFGKLTSVKANEVFKNLTGSEGKFNKDISLSDIYKSAREKGWVPEKINSTFGDIRNQFKDGLYI